MTDAPATRGINEPDHVAISDYGIDPETGVFRHPQAAPYFVKERPVPGSLAGPEDAQYIHNMTIEGHWPDLVIPGVSFQNIIDFDGRRILYHYYRNRVNVYDITDPANLVVLLKKTIEEPSGFFGAASIAYNTALGKWIMIQSFEVPRGGPAGLGGEKYSNPARVAKVMGNRGFRGIKLFELLSPTQWREIGRASTDILHPFADPAEGSGALDSPIYFGGKYAMIAAAPDSTFTRQEFPNYLYSPAQMIFDVENPAEPRLVSTWWVPGQRLGEEAQYATWQQYQNRTSWTGARMPAVPPVPIEEGGRYAYTAMGGLGFHVLDVSDPGRMHAVGSLALPLSVGGVEGDSVDVSRVVSRGIVLANGYPMNEDGYEPYKDVYIIDVKDPTAPRIVGTLPRPVPPADAPYSDFVLRRGKFGPKRSHYYWHPGTADPDVVVFPFNTGGIQVFDIADLANPRITAWFVPRMTDAPGSTSFSKNPMECITVEWDRKLIWGFANSGIYLLSSPALGTPRLSAPDV